MIFGYILSQKTSMPDSLLKIMIHRPMRRFPLRIVNPILIAISSKNGMFHREDKDTLLR